MNKWIECKDRMPTEHESIFAKFKWTEKWNPAMFELCSNKVLVVMEFPDGTRKVDVSYTIDGIWEKEKRQLVPHKITHWMPFPELPTKDGENDERFD